MIQNSSVEQSLSELIELQRQQLMQNQQILNMQQSNNASAKGSGAGQAPPTNSYNMPPMVSFSPRAQMQQAQFANYASSLSGQQGRVGVGDIFSDDHSRVSQRTRDLMGADFGARLSNATMAGAGALGASIVDFGGMSLLGSAGMGFFGSMAAGTIAGAAVGGVLDIGLDQAKQSQAYNKYLLQNSYRFINPFVSQNDRDIAGFGTQQRHEASSYLRNLNHQTYTTDNEIMMLTQKFTEGGLLKDTKNMTDFKNKMKSLVDTVKEGALMLNETYDTIATLMSDMKKAGIADKNFDTLLSKSKVTGAFIGQSGTQVTQDALNSGTGLTNGTELSAPIMTQRYQDAIIYQDSRYTTLKNKQAAGTITSDETRELNSITNLGGVSGTTTAVNSFQNQLLTSQNSLLGMNAINFFDYNKNTDSFEFNQSSFNKFINSGMNLDEISNASSKKLNSLSEAAKLKWENQNSTYTVNSLNAQQMYQFDNTFFDSMRKLSSYKDFSNEQLLDALGVQDSATRQAFVGMSNLYKSDNGQIAQKAAILTNQESTMASMNKYNVGLIGGLQNTWEGFKDWIGGPFQAASDAITDKVVQAQDLFYGKKFVASDVNLLTKYDYTSSGIQGTKDTGNALLANVSSLLTKANSNGSMPVNQNLADIVSGLMKGGSSDWTSRYIKENRTVFTDTSKLGLSSEKVKLLQDQADKNNLSETIVAALMKYGQTSGKGGLGANSDMLTQIAAALGKKVNGGDSGTSDQAAYLGKLQTAYGGNMNLALSAFFSSQSNVDQLLRSAGIDVNSLRNGGNINSLQGVDYKSLGLSNNVVNNVTNVTNSSNSYDGGGYSGDTYDVTGNKTNSTSPIDNVNYDYKRGTKSGVKDTSASGVDVYSLIHDVAKKNNVSADAVAAFFAVESGGNPDVGTSSAGAVGIAQVMPGTFRDMIKNGFKVTTKDANGKVVTRDAVESDIYNPEINAQVGAAYFKGQLTKANGNVYLAAAGYNAGGGRREAIENFIKQDYGIDPVNATAEQVSDTIMKHYVNNGDAPGLKQTADYVLKFQKNYLENRITKTKETITPKTSTTKTETVYVDEKTGKALSSDDVDKLIKDNTYTNSSQYNDNDLKNLYNNTSTSYGSILFDQHTLDINTSSYEKGREQAATGQNQINSKPSNIKDNVGFNMIESNRQLAKSSAGDIFSYFSNTVLGKYNSFMGNKTMNDSLKTIAEYQGKLEVDKGKLYGQFGSFFGIDKTSGQSDLAYQVQVDKRATDEYLKNQKVIDAYYNASDIDKAKSDWMTNYSQKQRLQILGYQQSYVNSGMFERNIGDQDNSIKNTKKKKMVNGVDVGGIDLGGGDITPKKPGKVNAKDVNAPIGGKSSNWGGVPTDWGIKVDAKDVNAPIGGVSTDWSITPSVLSQSKDGKTVPLTDAGGINWKTFSDKKDTTSSAQNQTHTVQKVNGIPVGVPLGYSGSLPDLSSYDDPYDKNKNGVPDYYENGGDYSSLLTKDDYAAYRQTLSFTGKMSGSDVTYSDGKLQIGSDASTSKILAAIELQNKTYKTVQSDAANAMGKAYYSKSSLFSQADQTKIEAMMADPTSNTAESLKQMKAIYVQQASDAKTGKDRTAANNKVDVIDKMIEAMTGYSGKLDKNSEALQQLGDYYKSVKEKTKGDSDIMTAISSAIKQLNPDGSNADFKNLTGALDKSAKALLDASEKGGPQAQQKAMEQAGESFAKAIEPILKKQGADGEAEQKKLIETFIKDSDTKTKLYSDIALIKNGGTFDTNGKFTKASTDDIKKAYQEVEDQIIKGYQAVNDTTTNTTDATTKLTNATGDLTTAVNTFATGVDTISKTLNYKINQTQQDLGIVKGQIGLTR